MTENTEKRNYAWYSPETDVNSIFCCMEKHKMIDKYKFSNFLNLIIEFQALECVIIALELRSVDFVRHKTDGNQTDRQHNATNEAWTIETTTWLSWFGFRGTCGRCSCSRCGSWIWCCCRCRHGWCRHCCCWYWCCCGGFGCCGWRRCCWRAGRCIIIHWRGYRFGGGFPVSSGIRSISFYCKTRERNGKTKN